MIASRMAIPMYFAWLGWVCSAPWWRRAPCPAPASSSGVAASVGAASSWVATAPSPGGAGGSPETSVSAIRMLLARVGDEVDDREDEDPHDVDEVPVEAGDLDLQVLLGRELAPQRDADQRQQPEDPDGHVHTVESGEEEEAAGRHAAREVQPFVGEDGELVDLTADEQRAEEGRGQEPDPQAAVVTPLDGGQRQHHGQRAHQEDEGADR